jgi:hypothetical protein
MESLNRCWPVTDKSKSAWQKRAIRCNECLLKSVCREERRVALAARIERVYRLRMKRRVQAYQRYPDLECIQTRSPAEFVSRPDQAGAFSKSCDGDDLRAVPCRGSFTQGV